MPAHHRQDHHHGQQDAQRGGQEATGSPGAPAFVMYFCDCLEKLTELPWKPTDLLNAKNGQTLGHHQDKLLINKLWMSLMAIVVRAEIYAQGLVGDVKSWTMPLHHMHQGRKAGCLPPSLKAACRSHLKKYWPEQAIALLGLITDDQSIPESRGLLIVLCWLLAGHGALDYLRQDKWQHDCYENVQYMEKENGQKKEKGGIGVGKAAYVPLSSFTSAEQRLQTNVRSSPPSTTMPRRSASASTNRLIQSYGRLTRALHAEQAMAIQQDSLTRRVAEIKSAMMEEEEVTAVKEDGSVVDVRTQQPTAAEYRMVKDDVIWNQATKAMEDAVEVADAIRASIKHEKAFWSWLNKSIDDGEGDGTAEKREHYDHDEDFIIKHQVACEAKDFPLPSVIMSRSSSRRQSSISKAAIRHGQNASLAMAEEMMDLRHYHHQVMDQLLQVTQGLHGCVEEGIAFGRSRRRQEA